MNQKLIILSLLALFFSASYSLSQSASAIASYLAPNGTLFSVLLDESNLGSSEVEFGEIIFAAGMESASHAHGSLEIFYVVEGVLEHIVNGTSHMLTPGMVGFVRAGDEVVHKVPGDQPVKTLVIWVPGGESAGIRSAWRQEPTP